MLVHHFNVSTAFLVLKVVRLLLLSSASFWFHLSVSLGIQDLSIQHYSRSRIPVFLLEKTLLVERQFYAAECSDSLKSNPDICHTQSLVYLPLTPLDHLDFSKNRLCPFISRLTKMLAHSFMAINQGKSREFCTNPAASFHSN